MTFALAAAALLTLPAAPETAASPPVVTEDAAQSGAFPGAERADDDRLHQTTARADLSVLAQSRQAATVASSSVNGQSVTGEATVGGQAFENASGLVLVNINTGNNVAMNASMDVNIVINPQP